MKREWFFNPVAATEVRALMRGRKWVYAIVILAFLGTVGVFVIVTAGPSGTGWVTWLAGPLFAFVELTAAVTAAARVLSRRAQRTLDELLTTRIPPVQILGGLVTPSWVMAAPAFVLGAVFLVATPLSQWGIGEGTKLPWHVYLVDAISIAGTAFAWSLLGAAFGARHKHMAAAIVRLLIVILVAKVLFTSCWMYAAGFGDTSGGPTPLGTAGWNLGRFTQERNAGFAFGLGWYVLLWAQWGVLWGWDEPGALLWTALVITLGAWQFRRAARRLGRTP